MFRVYSGQFHTYIYIYLHILIKSYFVVPAPESSKTSMPDDGGGPVEIPGKYPLNAATEYRTAEYLMSKAIAPVNVEYLRPLPSINSLSAEIHVGVDDDDAGRKTIPSAIVQEKKSNRQLKRERKQEQKSTVRICSEVAKSGKANECRFADSCRYNHDIDAFLAQKPADLEGVCPFVSLEELCPYGITCRFLNTHKDHPPSSNLDISKKSSEINALNKDLQRLLWKNKILFPKADAQLKALGLKGGKSFEVKAVIVFSN
ncbi:tRNA-dihydrouridine(47) synthase [NAD(P)(+)]-like [Platanthera zijinensis]|uniref:tRNA-dihydrouridine(47) synthase [NAD(P)(+)] n=1 Tax=Platanthera zijinensis TaxID=2320716 RepID=A0AAP0C4L7_9ASPA